MLRRSLRAVLVLLVRTSVDRPRLERIHFFHTNTRGFTMSFGDEADIDYTTAKGRDWPSVRQFNVFLANRLKRVARFGSPIRANRRSASCR